MSGVNVGGSWQAAGCNAGYTLSADSKKCLKLSESKINCSGYGWNEGSTCVKQVAAAGTIPTAGIHAWVEVSKNGDDKILVDDKGGLRLFHPVSPTCAEGTYIGVLKKCVLSQDAKPAYCKR